MADPGRDCLTGEIQCINHLVFLNLDTTDKLTQAEIILTDYKTKKKKMLIVEKSNIYKSKITNRAPDL